MPGCFTESDACFPNPLEDPMIIKPISKVATSISLFAWGLHHGGSGVRSALGALGASLAMLLSSPAFAAGGHGDHHHGGHHDHKVNAPRAYDPAQVEPKAFGRQGDPTKVKRTLTVHMDDRMRFTPNRFDVKRGETVRLVVRSGGKAMHELVLGTEADMVSHAEMMKRFPDMEHDEPHMAHVPPGGRGEIVWTFDQAGEVHFACLIPGHFEAGMRGVIRVR